MGLPGIMVYFDAWRSLLDCDDAFLGAFFRAALRYAEDGTEPDFTGAEAVIWGMLRADMQRDAERYAETVAARRYAAYCRYERAAGRTPATRSAWLHMQTPAADAVQAVPTTAPTTAPTPTTATANAVVGVEDNHAPGPMAVPTDAPPAGREGERARALASLLCDSLASRGTAVSEDQRRSWAGLFYRLHERGYRNRDMRRALRYALSSPAWRERMTDAEAFARHLDELLAQSGGDAA